MSSSKNNNQNLVLVAMILAVSMLFIDQTIVALAVPGLSTRLGLSSTGAQWIVNGYLLALSALFAFGGRLGDVLGHRRMVILGVTGFGVTSALCGATPDGALAEPWLIVCRMLQGASGAMIYPSALAIVAATFPARERGRALAMFFGVSSGMTAIGPVLGGYLTEWTWRSIFWINVPIAALALVLTFKARPAQTRKPAPIAYRDAVLLCGGIGLAVLGLQQSAVWGWGGRTFGCLAAGLLITALFVAVQLRKRDPLIDVRVFTNRAFAADSVVLTLISAAFVPFFFFASMYAQASLGESASSAGTLLLAFFGGCVVAAQIGGRSFDARGAKPSVMLGCALSAAGFLLWGTTLTRLDLHAQLPWLILAGAGFGFIIGPVGADALSRAPHAGPGAVTGITQTVRNLGASIGLAVMGALFITHNTARVTGTLTSSGVPGTQAHDLAHRISAGDTSAAGGSAPASIVHAVRLDFAHSTQTIAWIMAAVMLAALIVASIGLPAGRQDHDSPIPTQDTDATTRHNRRETEHAIA